jgi:threonylcarbamoyladenosine tRNA methylthiotransferase MtaB
MFTNTLNLLDECDLTYLHVFPYSARKGTPAARMPQVPMERRKARAQALREAGERRLQAFLGTQVGREISALVEKPGRGRSEHYAPVALTDAIAPAGVVVKARVLSVADGALLAEPI